MGNQFGLVFRLQFPCIVLQSEDPVCRPISYLPIVFGEVSSRCAIILKSEDPNL